MNLGVIIQARMGSTRLPGKILLPFNGEITLLDFILDKLHKIPTARVVVATTDNPGDDSLVRYLLNKGELVYRGSETDVLDRFICAAECHNIDSIIRICSDNPFIDLNSLIKLSKEAQENPNYDYIGFRINNKPSILTHFGFWGEYVSLKALKAVRNITIDSSAHEHVTYYIYNHQEIFDCKWLNTPTFLQGREDIRLTIDTKEDYDTVKRIHRDLCEIVGEYNLENIVEYLNNHNSLTKSMSRIINDNIKK